MIKRMMHIILLVAVILAMVSCGTEQNAGYEMVTAEEAKAIMDKQSDYIILDVRTQEEYDEGHIPGAILIPDYEIEEKAPQQLKNKEQTIMVYCRSGNRSKGASEKLAQIGYTNVIEFGGINEWPYDIEKDKTYKPCNKPGNEKLK